MNNAGSRIKADAAQVQGEGGVHALRVLRKPDAEFMRHLPDHGKRTGLAALRTFAHHLQNHSVLH